MKIKILCTLGPASLDHDVIRGLDDRGVDLFRINLSHTSLESVASTIEFVREVSSTPICLDTQGAQVRCGMVAPDVELHEGEGLRLTAEDVEGTGRELTLWPGSTFDALVPGSIVAIDFDGARLEITSASPGEATAVVVSGGRVKSNKAVTVDPPPVLPPLTEKDRAAIDIGAPYGIRHVALSFASSADDVALIRSLAPEGTHVISKIESRAGVRNMDSIISVSDSVLIDRGDLSREVPLEHVPYYQKAIARRANRWNRSVYVATNLLESMVTSRQPTIAEANDIANTLLDGVHGLVLAAEAAVGIDPVGSVDMILRAVEAFEQANEGQLLEEDRGRLITPA
jgi:sulfate adenylyltransferase